MKMKVGFIGVGQMGGRMARRLLHAGYNLTVYDLRKDGALSLLEEGAGWVDTPKAMAESCQVILSSLPGPPEVEAVVRGPSGLMQGWKKGDIYVDMTTNSPTSIRRIAEDARSLGVAVLDAPVSGGPPGAELGTLSIMVGGDEDALEKVRTILNAIGNKILSCGEVGYGNVAKLVNNLILFTCISINSEGFVLGVKAGMNPQKLYEVVKASSGNNWHIDRLPVTVFKGDFEPGFKLNLACKDIGLALALGKELGMSLPVGSAVAEGLAEAKAKGLGERGVQSIIQVLEEEAGIKVRSPG
jgi:3-hydroxyisobutyrate dehydrogenase-like beta-hydroxyacid dehydrogenase